MPHDHSHAHLDPESGDRRVSIAIWANALLTVAQIVGGIFAGSLALIADALHNFSDMASLVIAFAAMTAATALPLVSSAAPALGVSSLVVGAMVPAIITLTAGVVVELSPAVRRQQIWGWATLSFALTQTIGGFGMSRLYAATGSYLDTIAAGALLLVVGTICVIAALALQRGD